MAVRNFGDAALLESGKTVLHASTLGRLKWVKHVATLKKGWRIVLRFLDEVCFCFWISFLVPFALYSRQFGTRTCHFARYLLYFWHVNLSVCMVFAACWYFKRSWPLILHGIRYMLVLQTFIWVSFWGIFKVSLGFNLGFFLDSFQVSFRVSLGCHLDSFRVSPGFHLEFLWGFFRIQEEQKKRTSWTAWKQKSREAGTAEKQESKKKTKINSSPSKSAAQEITQLHN